MVAGKFKLKTVNESPLMEISNTLGSPLHPNKKQLSLKSSLRKSKLRASEYSSKVKKSLIGYFPKSNNASSECQSAKPKVEGLQKLVNELLERQTELQSQLEMKKSELERLSDRIQMLEIEKGHFSNEISMASSLKMELFIAKSQIEELEKAQKSNKERETESKQLLRLNSELQNGTDDTDCHPWKAERYQPVYMRTGQNGIHETDHTEEYLQRQTTALPKPTEDTHMDAPNNVEKVPLVSCMEWVNANLRNEIHSSKSPSGKKGTEDSSVSLSSKSQPSCKQFLSGEKGVRQKSQRRGSDFEGLASFPSSTHDETGHSDDLKRTSYSSSTSETGQSDESKRLSSYSSSLSETGQSDDSNLERFEGLIGISRWARRKSKSKRALDRRDNWLLPHEDHSSVSSSPRHSFSLSDKSSNCNLPPHTGDYRHYHNKENNNADSEIRKASFSDIESHHLEKSRNCLPGKSNSKQKLLDDQHRSDGEVEELSKQSSDKSTKTESKWDKDNHIYKTFDETRKPLTSAPKRPSGAINFETDALQQLKHPAAIGRRPQRIPKPPPKPSWMPPPVNTLATGTKGIELASPTIPAFPPSSKVVPPPPPPPPPGSKVAPPPPPPPPPGSKVAPTPPALVQKQSMVNTMRRVPELVEFYHSLMKRDQKRDSCVSGTTDNSDVSNVRSNMIGEIENRSAYLLAIKNDVETQGEFVRSLIREVQAAHYTNIEDVVEFVKWLDEELSFLVDERAVLKHFEWPERKADALREAACGYSELKKIYSEVFSYEDDRHNSCNNSLKKMFALLERIEQKVDGFLQMRDMTMGRYKEFNIPYDWMLDNGIVRQIKLASVKLARMYMTRVTKELESRGSAEKESVNESLLCQGVRFAFRVHQFAGGFDAETMSAFEQMKKLGQMNHKH